MKKKKIFEKKEVVYTYEKNLKKIKILTNYNKKTDYHILEDWVKDHGGWVLPDNAWALILDCKYFRKCQKAFGGDTPNWYIKMKKDKKNNKGNIKLTIKPTKFFISRHIHTNNSSIKNILGYRKPKDVFKLKYLLEKEGYKVEVEGFNNIKNVADIWLSNDTKLRSYQTECVEFFKEHNYQGIMALDMGLGKTITALKCFEESDAKSLIIVAPANLMEQWRDTIITHFNYNMPTVISSKTKPADRIEFLKNNPIVITSFDLLKNINFNIHRDFLIIDEIQKVKNWNTQRAKSISKIVSRYKIGLTGTPIENRLAELYNIADQVSPAFYGKYKDFENQYIIKGPFKNIIGYRNLEKIFEKSQDLIFRKLKEDVDAELPEITQIEQVCHLDKKERKKYNEMYKEFKSIEKTQQVGKLQELKSFCSNSALKMKNNKFTSKEKALVDLLNDELSERKVIVFTQYAKNMDRFYKLAEHNKIPSLFLSGKNSKETEKIKTQFINYPGRVVLFMTDVVKYGADGLQESDALINFDLPYSPSDLKQRIGRVNRIGSKHKNNLIINLITDTDLDGHIIDIINSKELLASTTIDGIQKHLIGVLS